MNEPNIDWKSTTALLRGFMRGAAQPSDVEDLVQEASVRLLRAVRREPPLVLEALARDIARKTAIDHYRRQTRWRECLRELRLAAAQDPPAETPPAGPLGDPQARLRFLVLNYFRDRSPECHQLATTWFRQERSWASVAAESGRNPDAVRQQWSRCVRFLRQEIERDPSFLSDWMGYRDRGGA